MSVKWVRSKRWDEEHLTGWLTPAKWVLRVLSSITLAVVLLVLLSLFGVMASIPVGMLALVPTLLVYAATLIVPWLVVGVLPAVVMWYRLGRERPMARMLVGAGLVVGMGVGVTWAWSQYLWPVMQYNSLTGEGLRFFADFVQKYAGVPLRRLPGLEMSELEFYAWWPLNLLLYLFVVNMVVATLRRIEFKFENLGVLTVHTGIVTIALGSAYYSVAKQEGDTLLQAGGMDERGVMQAGPLQPGFYDNTRTVLRLDQGRGWEQRLLNGVPRYNSYNLNVLGDAITASQTGDEGRVLDIEVPPPPAWSLPAGIPAPVDPDIHVRLVGYAPYAELVQAWQEVPPGERSAALAGSEEVGSLRRVDLVDTRPAGSGPGASAGLEQRAMTFELLPERPADRVAMLTEALALEHTIGMNDVRWNELRTFHSQLRGQERHGLIVDVPGADGRAAISRFYPISKGQVIELRESVGPMAASEAGGRLRFVMTVLDITGEPPFPIVTKGYENATSAVAQVRVVPVGEDGQPRPEESYTRWIYDRFPAIAQDLLDTPSADGRPSRRPADPSISLRLIDASRVQVYLDERPAPGGAGPVARAETVLRAMVLVPGLPARVFDDLREGSLFMMDQRLGWRIGSRQDAVRRVAVPRLVPETEQDRDNVGNHRRAALAVEVSLRDAQGKRTWARTVWLDHRQYAEISQDNGTPVTLPDGREVRLMFARLWRPLPNMALRLREFEMIPYPHSTQPRDFRSDVEVIRGPGVREVLSMGRFMGPDRAVEEALKAGTVDVGVRSTSLNDPLLQSPHYWSDQQSVVANVYWSIMDTLGPSRFKFSQNGWDAQGWARTREQAEAGQLPRPFAQFTILGVGNNPGIHIIALGGILMVLGIPWAFYVKPALLRRRKLAIQRELMAAGKMPKVEPRMA